MSTEDFDERLENIDSLNQEMDLLIAQNESLDRRDRKLLNQYKEMQRKHEKLEKKVKSALIVIPDPRPKMKQTFNKYCT